MAATDAQVIAATARWNDENLYLRDFVTKNRTPIVVKIIKGQHGTIGVPTLSNPTLNSTVLLISTGKKRKVIAQSVKFKENQRVVSVGSRIAIPETYTGWFELLSEEGRSIKCIDSVSELSKKKSNHFQYLVRDSIRCLIGSETLNGSTIAEGSKILNAGEIIFPCGEIQLPLMKIRHLKCQDSNGGLVLLSLDQRGRFSPIISDDDVSGVRLISNLIDKKMPLPVRLVHGPSLKGLKNTNQFVPEMKLLQMYEEETIFALPLQKEPIHLTKIPLSATLKLLKAKNNDSLQVMPEFQRLLDKSNKLINETVDDIQIFDCVKKSSSSISLFRRSSSSDNMNQKSCVHQKTPNRVKLNENLKEYDEIDLIYDYVRGFAPLPKNLKQSYSESTQMTNNHNNGSCPPEPPPIETIPTKKLQPEKRNHRQTTRSLSHNQTDNLLNPSTKLYLKNGNSNRLRYFRQKSSPPSKDQLSSPSVSPPILVKIGSPLFGLQYKSLNNLQQAMELDGTLNSSNSGGRFSVESADGFIKQPDKRSRRLLRPKSLTNLVWEVREAPVIVEKPKLLTYKKLSSKFFFGGHKHAGTLYL